jgi:hypothetical protein
VALLAVQQQQQQQQLEPLPLPLLPRRQQQRLLQWQQ